MTPYEYHNGKLGVQGRYLFSGKDAAKDSLCLIGDRGFRFKIQNNSIVRIRVNGPGLPMLVEYSTLPAAWQDLLVTKWGNPPSEARQTWCERLYERDAKAYAYYSERFGALTDKTERYTTNASVLNLYGKLHDMRLEYRKLQKSCVAVNGDEWVPSLRESITADIEMFRGVVMHTLPCSMVALRSLFNKYKTDGYGALIHKNEGNQFARVVTGNIEKLLNDMFATQNHKPTMVEVHEQYNAFISGKLDVINNETGEVYDPGIFPALSRTTVKSYLSAWRNRIATHAMRSGDRQKYMQRFKPYHSLEQPKYAGSIISIDDRQPVFEYDDAHNRVWFYNGIDLGSEAFTVWVHGRDKKDLILNFYRQMVRNYAEWGFNLPAEVECESNLNSSFKETFLREGTMFQYVRIEANNARGKRIERYYGNLRYQYEKKREGWLARPFALSEANEKGGAKVPIIPYDEIVAGCLKDIETWNNTEHSKIKGKSRWEVFCETQHPNLRPTNYKAIIPLLGYKTQASCRAGIVKFKGGEFLLGNDGVIAVGDPLIDLMDMIEGKHFDIYWLDGNDHRVLKAYAYIGDRFICELIEKPPYAKARIEQGPNDETNRTLMSKYTATIEGFGRRQYKAIDRVTVVDRRTFTINNKFVMPGLSRPEYATAEVLDDGADEPDLTAPVKAVSTKFNTNLTVEIF